MNTVKLRIIGLALIAIFLAAACTPTPTPPSGTSSTCPPLGAVTTDQVGGSDGSSITVYSGTYGDTDTTPSTPWCSPSQLAITVANLAGLPPCPYAGCLIAVDVKPDNIDFSNPSNTTSTKPTLSYDLAEHPPSESGINLEDCSNNYSCFAFYREDSGTWIYAGSATTTMIGSEWFATGRINHFSVFALVQLPQPAAIQPPRAFGMVVQSDFLEDENGGLSVAVLIAEDREGEFSVDSGERVLRLTGVEPLEFEGEIDPACEGAARTELLFTCLFPTGTRIELLLEEFAAMRGLESGEAILFSVQNVEIH